MPDIQVPKPPITASKAGRALHDLGLASLFGGNLFARIALSPAVTAISNPSERGLVVNRSWRRYGTVNSLSLAAVIVGWSGARANEARPGKLSRRERSLALVKDGLVATTAVTGVATAIGGVRLSAQTHGGDVPLDDGATPAADAPAAAARSKRVLNVLGAVNLASTAALIAVNAALAQETFRRPPLRRLVPGA
ncbi:hypothetical protein DSM112329_00829 [Paraconexibacter sp. AEG42_29]|uniref:DUF4149 domain-containing protein n=1 Tax=Paraconexibacter sp. AEG42_29 TaxID=2997339 RepID=A0AAU7AR09_9ACTN